MANLLPDAPRSPARGELSEVEQAFHDNVIEGLELGLTAIEIARKLAPKDRKKARSLRRRIVKMAANDLRFQANLIERAQGRLMLGLIPTVDAVSRRAGRGNPAQARLLLEATGFHNPKVKHEHSGDIKVHVSMPRPERIEQAPDGSVVDADVVEEE